MSVISQCTKCSHVTTHNSKESEQCLLHSIMVGLAKTRHSMIKKKKEGMLGEICNLCFSTLGIGWSISHGPYIIGLQSGPVEKSVNF